MNQLTPFTPKHSEAIIMAQGPSREKLFNSPKFAASRDLALVNRAGLDWPHEARFWITYHAEWMSRWWGERELNDHPMPETVIVSANKNNNIDHIPNFNISVQVQGLNSGGTSAILAAMVLLDMGYDVIHLFGVDLTKPYDKERKFWRPLKGERLVFHGNDWFHRKRFGEQKENR